MDLGDKSSREKSGVEVGFGCSIIEGVLYHTQACEIHARELFEKAYEKGYADAIEQAAKVAENYRCNDQGEKCYPCDCGGVVPQDELPEQIRALRSEAGRGKGET